MTQSGHSAILLISMDPPDHGFLPVLISSGKTTIAACYWTDRSIGAHIFSHALDGGGRLDCPVFFRWTALERAATGIRRSGAPLNATTGLCNSRRGVCILPQYGRVFEPAATDVHQRLACLASGGPGQLTAWRKRLRANAAGSAAPSPGDVMPSFSLPDETGRFVSLEDLLETGPAAITFHRGHWCPYCRINTRALAEVQEQIVSDGASIIAITPEREVFGHVSRKMRTLAIPFCPTSTMAMGSRSALRSSSARRSKR